MRNWTVRETGQRNWTEKLDSERETGCLQRSRERSATVGEREMEIDSERETG